MIMDSVKCVPNECLCPNGEALSPCPHNNAFICHSCSEGFGIHYYGSKQKTCEKNVEEMIMDNQMRTLNAKVECVCKDGIPAAVPECLFNGEHRCVSCFSDGYKINEDNVCVPKVCDCDNGFAIPEGQCLMEGVQQCQMCDDGFEKKYMTQWDAVHGQTYVIACEEIEEVKEGHCDFGTPASGDDCPANGQHRCAVCDVGFVKETFETLNDDGVVDGFSERCVVIVEEVEVVTEKPKICTCDYGVAVTGEACTEDGLHLCASCNSPGYYVDEFYGNCVPKQCLCENGFGLNDGTCLDANAHRCAFCDEHFEKKTIKMNDHFMEICESMAGEEKATILKLVAPGQKMKTARQITANMEVHGEKYCLGFPKWGAGKEGKKTVGLVPCKSNKAVKKFRFNPKDKRVYFLDRSFFAGKKCLSYYQEDEDSKVQLSPSSCHTSSKFEMTTRIDGVSYLADMIGQALPIHLMDVDMEAHG